MKTIDCVVCGETCLDLIIGPIPQQQPLESADLLRVDPILAVTGGIVPNAGVAMARLGLNVAALCLVGSDEWGAMICRRLADEQIDITHVIRHRTAASSATAVLIGEDGGHTFAFSGGASQLIDRSFCLERLDLFAQSKMALFGYYNLLPRLERDLPEVLAAVRETGCRTALDTTNGGGSLQPLNRILPHLDVYLPSLAEAQGQTAQTEPQEMLRTFRQYAPGALLGIKLGEHGALLSPAADSYLAVSPVRPPSAVVDTTGAGDCFFAGLLAGLLRDLPLPQAARLGAAAGACCVTGRGGSQGLRDWDSTLALGD